MAPAIVPADKLNVCNAHNGELAKAVGAPGGIFTFTLTVPEGPVHPATVAVTE